MYGLVVCVILGRLIAASSASDASASTLMQRFDQLEKNQLMLLERQRETDEELSNIKVFTSKQAKTIQDHREVILTLQKQLARQEYSMMMQTENILKNSQSLSEIKNTCETANTNRDKRQSSGAVAFTVYNDVGQNPQPGEIVKYNDIVTNEGGAFDIQKGVFTAPKAGMYFFIFTVGESHVHSVWLKLVVNNEEKVDAAVDTFHQNQDLQGSNAAVLRLRAGDQVWVGAYENTGYTITGGERLTTFTGVFLSD